MNNSGSGPVGNHFGTGVTALEKLRRLGLGFARFFARTRCKPLLLITAACLLIGEQYPFSSFPMYASFGPSTYYLYLADGSGNAVACFPTLGMSSASLKKVFSTEMRKERGRLHLRAKKLTLEQKKVVGDRLLARLQASPAARGRGGVKPDGLRIYEVNITQRDQRFEKETALIAELR